jgi:hypothetical protein
MFFKSTSKHPLQEIRGLVEFAALHSKADLSRTQVNVKNCRHPIAGRAYFSVPRISKSSDPNARELVVLRIGRAKDFPHSNMMYEWVRKGDKDRRWLEKREKHPYGGKSSPLIVMQTWQEGLLALAAHEFHHIWQFQNKRPKSEVECEKTADAALRAYRAARHVSEADSP